MYVCILTPTDPLPGAQLAGQGLGIGETGFGKLRSAAFSYRGLQN